jgi:heme A synthase
MELLQSVFLFAAGIIVAMILFYLYDKANEDSKKGDKGPMKLVLVLFVILLIVAMCSNSD